MRVYFIEFIFVNVICKVYRSELNYGKNFGKYIEKIVVKNLMSYKRINILIGFVFIFK